MKIQYAIFILMFLGLSSPGFSETPNNAAEADGETVAKSEAIESWYPRTVIGDKGKLVVYAPQIDVWKNFETITAWVAFRVTLAGSEHTYYGSIGFEAQTDTDIQTRAVLLHDVVIQKLTIEGLEEDADEFQVVREAFTATPRTVPLDLVLEYLPAEMDIASAGGLNTEPPRIFTATEPALLLSIDSEPVFVPVGESQLQFVINTNWDVLRDGDEGALYFCQQGAWLTAADFDETWGWASSLPGEFRNIPQDANWSDVHDCLPDDLNALTIPEHPAPAVFYSTAPAELLLLDGEPRWEAIGEGGLSYASNTVQELFRVDDDVFFLISGRWFSAPGIAGPWSLAAELSDAFQDIPPDEGEDSHLKSFVRASVPGTQEAWEAALVASIPRKAEILRGTESALNLDVQYAGEPVFTSIASTDIEMAVNTTSQVLRYEGAYYLCHNAVWLTAFGANGPWVFAESVPAEFAAIPPSSPAYNTTFVSIDGSDEEGIDYAYTSGYEGAYVSNSTVVYGTGYPSPAISFAIVYGVYGGGYGYPHYPYYPWPPTYGHGSWYNPHSGRYGEAVVGYGPYGAAGGAAVYNPSTGTYARGQAVWDNDELAGRGFAYNPNTDTSIARNRYIDFDDNEGWSQRVAQRGNQWRYSESEWEDGRMVTEFESSRGTEGEVYRERQGDTIVSEGQVTGNNRSATFDSVISDGGLSTNIQGSEGGTGQLDRQSGNGEITGGGTFTKDGKTIETDVRRTEEGVRREIETSGGGQGVSMRNGEDNAFAYQSGSGDVYAGRDGNVYQKTDDGWAPVENPGSQAASSDARAARSEGTVTTARTGAADSRTATGKSGAGKYEALPAGGFAGAQNSVGSASSSRFGDSGAEFSSRNPSLDRDFQSRQNGFNRYSQYQSGSGLSSRSRTRSYGGRRRR